MLIQTVGLWYCWDVESRVVAYLTCVVTGRDWWGETIHIRAILLPSPTERELRLLTQQGVCESRTSGSSAHPWTIETVNVTNGYKHGRYCACALSWNSRSSRSGAPLVCLLHTFWFHSLSIRSLTVHLCTVFISKCGLFSLITSTSVCGGLHESSRKITTANTSFV